MYIFWVFWFWKKKFILYIQIFILHIFNVKGKGKLKKISECKLRTRTGEQCCACPGIFTIAGDYVRQTDLLLSPKFFLFLQV